MGVSGIVPRTVTTRFRRGGSWASDVFRQDGLFGIFHTAHSADSTSACSKHRSRCLSPVCPAGSSLLVVLFFLEPYSSNK